MDESTERLVGYWTNYEIAFGVVVSIVMFLTSILWYSILFPVVPEVIV